MNVPRPVNLQDSHVAPRLSSVRTGRKIVIGMFAALIVAVMIAWFGFLGWGIVETTKIVAVCLRKLWITLL